MEYNFIPPLFKYTFLHMTLLGDLARVRIEGPWPRREQVQLSTSEEQCDELNK